MKISVLAATSGVSVPTIKFYLREGLLHPGAVLNRTQADYDTSHVDRVRLVRALIVSGGLSLAEVRKVLDALDAPPPTWHQLLGRAQDALSPGQVADPTAAQDADGIVKPSTPSPARRLISRQRWQIHSDTPAIGELDRALAVAGDAGIILDDAILDGYAGAVTEIAQLDIQSVPDEPAAALRQVVLGTVLLEPVLRCLRLLTQQDVSFRTFWRRAVQNDGDVAE